MRASPLRGTGALLVLLLAGCGDDPRVARRASALDVAGGWVEVLENGASGAAVTIANEADKNDVVVTVNSRVLTDEEATAVSRVTAPDARDRLQQVLLLGQGRDAIREETDGGENVSFDLGATTTLQVTSAPEPVSPTAPERRAASLVWSLRLDGTPDGLSGTLTLTLREEQPRVGDANGFALIATTVTSAPLVLAPTP